MKYYLTDTHALYWYFINSPRLGAQANLAFDEADQGQALLYVPAIVLAELYYLNKKHGAPLDFAAVLAQLQQSAQFVLLSFDANDVLDFEKHAAVPEMHDRMIVGAALRLGAACLTCDGQIMRSGLVSTIW